MQEIFRALASPQPLKNKVHNVKIQGKVVEVSLQKKLEILQAGEDNFMIVGNDVVRRPVTKTRRKFPVLMKSDTGYKFKNGDPYWVETIAEEGHTWQIESE